MIDALGINGIYIVTGIAEGTRPVTVNGADLMRQLVLKNQVVLGSVNASIDHYKLAVTDLESYKEKWPEVTDLLITERIPYTDFKQALQGHTADEIKVVIEWL